MVYTVSDDVYLEEGNRGEEKTGKKKVLFLCTSNSARSQMAEGLLRALYGDRYEAYSAGVVATAVDPRALSVMMEIGVDISGQRSKAASELEDIVFDAAVTVCDRAREACPVCTTDLDLPSRAPKAREVIHKRFEDPAAVSGTEEEQLCAFRQARDEIRGWIVETFG
ncbi:MAG TPA: arsenate reductase ArsC [Methanothrix sp.]|nr:arsenate reductase ArsC [Methanothrix sp.]